VQGSCYWWARKHRSHHRYTDTDLDPYNAKRGLLWAHIGWMLFSSEGPDGRVDVSDLRKNPLVQWQHRFYFALTALFGYVLPTVVPGLAWGDWEGGFLYAGALRLTVAHHVRPAPLNVDFSLLAHVPFASPEHLLHQLDRSLLWRSFLR
jgi:stearoyl-CoA desaturase (delta-9 desaturase)